MAAAETFHDQSHVTRAFDVLDQATIVTERTRQQGHRCTLILIERRQVHQFRETKDDSHSPLHEPAQGAHRRRLKRRGARRVRLAHEASRVNFVVEHDERAESHGVGCGGDSHRGEQVRRTVGTGQRRIAHRSRHHDGLGSTHEEIERKRGLLQGVRALGHDHAGRATVEARGDLARESDEVRQREITGGELTERHARDVGHVG